MASWTEACERQAELLAAILEQAKQQTELMEEQKELMKEQNEL